MLTTQLPSWISDASITFARSIAMSRRRRFADLRPPAFDRPVCVTWHRTDAAVTDPLRLTPHGARHGLEQTALWAVTELPGGGGLRRRRACGLNRRKRWRLI